MTIIQSEDVEKGYKAALSKLEYYTDTDIAEETQKIREGRSGHSEHYLKGWMMAVDPYEEMDDEADDLRDLRERFRIDNLMYHCLQD